MLSVMPGYAMVVGAAVEAGKGPGIAAGIEITKQDETADLTAEVKAGTTDPGVAAEAGIIITRRIETMDMTVTLITTMTETRPQPVGFQELVMAAGVCPVMHKLAQLHVVEPPSSDSEKRPGSST